MMEEKESTVSGSPGNSAESTDSPPPLSISELLPQPPPQMINNVNINAAAINSIVTMPPPTMLGNSGSGGGDNVDVLGKKKRGRPRKYDADGNLRVRPAVQRQQQPPFHSSMSPPPPLVSSPGFSLSFGSHDRVVMSSSSPKRARGRPAGSGNWQLLASLGELFANTAGGDFTPHVATVNSGEDVAGKILSFSQKGSRGVCVLSANGAVSNVTIRQPGASGGILTYEGRFEILTLTGSFTVTETGGARKRTGGLSVSLASPDGRVIGGGVAGLLLAASPIQIVVGSFTPYGYVQQKRKYQRHHTTVSRNPGTMDMATATKPVVTLSKPDGETCLTPTQIYPGQSYSRTDSTALDKQIPHTNNAHNDCWNGIEPITDQRISPDINLSLPLEEDVEGVL